MRTSDEHTKLARVALDFWPDLDSAFDLNVAKARVNLPADLRIHLKPMVERLVKEARRVYSSSRGQQSSRSNAGLSRIGTAIGDAASLVGEEAALKRIKRALKTQSPKVAKEIGWST